MLFVFSPVHESPNFSLTIFSPEALQLKVKMVRDVAVSTDILEGNLVVEHLCQIRELRLSLTFCVPIFKQRWGQIRLGETLKFRQIVLPSSGVNVGHCFPNGAFMTICLYKSGC